MPRGKDTSANERDTGKWLSAGLIVAWLGVLLSALGAVYARHEARKLFVELQELQGVRDELEIEWGRLQIEQGMLATHARVEQLAREELDMRLPEPAEVSVLSDE